MEIEIRRDFPIELGTVWQDLLHGSSADPVFGSFVWAREWWTYLRRRNDRLRIVLMRDNSRYAGLAGLHITLERWGPMEARVLAPLGRTTGEYLDLLFPPGEKDLHEILIGRLLAERDWDVLSLTRLPKASPTRKLARNAASKFGLTVIEEAEEVCPFIELNGSFEELMTSRFSKKRRGNIRRQSRKLNELGRQRFEMVTGESNLEEKLDQVFKLEDRSWKGLRGLGIFRTEEMRTFFSRVSKELAMQDDLALHLQYLDDRLISYSFGFSKNDRLYCYSLAYDPDYAQFSPGLLTLVDLLRYAFEKKVRIFDFLRGAERHKKLWTDSATQNINLHIFGRGPKARTLALGLGNRLFLRRLKRRLKKSSNAAQFEIR